MSNSVVGPLHESTTKLVQLRQTICVHSTRKLLACARASKLKTTNLHISRPRSESHPAVKPSGLNARLPLGYQVQVLAWSSRAQSVGEWAFSLLANWCLRLPSFGSGGSEFDPCWAHDNVSVPFVGLYAFPCARVSKLNQQICSYMCRVLKMFKYYSSLFIQYLHENIMAC